MFTHLLGLMAGLLLTAGVGTLANAQTPEWFDWDSITPTPDLRYSPCYTGHQCARLQVPLDWLDTNNTNPSTVAIAIIKRPATVPDSDPTFGGSVLVNPGGPGGSGVAMALTWGERFQRILDGKKNYEIIGFDPRGVSFSTPRADCYQNELSRAYESFQAHGSGVLREDNSKLGWRLALAKAYGKRCGDALGGEGGILRHGSTSSVARDMVEIIDRIDDLRENEKANDRGSGGPDVEQVRLGGGSAAGEREPARLQYLGFSYGTLLGNTFASMFPGRVGRMVLDGVVGVEQYMDGTWLDSPADVNHAIDYIYQTCFNTKTACPLFDGTEDSWQDIRTRVNSAIAPLKHSPIPLDTTHYSLPLTDADVNGVIFISTYKPNDLLPMVWSFLSALLTNDTPTLAAIMEALSAVPQLDGLCGDCTGASCPPVISTDAMPAVACSDGDDATSLTLEEWTDYFNQMNNQSAVATTLAEVRFLCAGWPARPKYRFNGPFSTPKHDSLVVEGKPAAPILFLSSTIDPVTPLASAYKESARHPGSVVVVQDSVGHCALGSAVSSCTEEIVRRYFEDGTVPEGGAACEVDCPESAMCADEKEETAPVVWPGVGGLSHGMSDLGRMREVGMSWMRDWQAR